MAAGPFFLFDTAADLRLDCVRSIFKERGFSNPTIIEGSGWQLWVYPKPLVSSPCVFEARGLRLVVCGTLAYRGLSTFESCRRLAADFLDGEICGSELRGSYCCVFIRGDDVNIALDGGGLFQIFQDHKGRAISSSFLALASAIREPLSINREAAADLLLVGAALGSNTLLCGVERAGLGGGAELRGRKWSILEHSGSSGSEIHGKPAALHEAADSVVSNLRQVFAELTPLSKDLGVCVGLSGGYDSRVLVLLATEMGIPICGFSHPKPSPDPDPVVAQEVAAALNLPFVVEPFRSWKALELPVLEYRMKGNFLFGDGLCNRGFDLAKDEFSVDYRRRVRQGAGLVLGGVGGELMRNFNRCPPGRVDTREWLKTLIVGHRFLAAVKPKYREDLLDGVISRLSPVIGEVSQPKIKARAVNHRFYGEVWLPCWHGARSSAENQVGYFLSPFAEPDVVANAYRLAEFIGTSARLESEVLRSLNQGIALLRSSYGYRLAPLPFRTILGDWARGAAPLRIRRVAGAIKSNTTRQVNGAVLDSSGPLEESVLQRAVDSLKSVGLPIQWDRVMGDRSLCTAVTTVGITIEFLREVVARPS